MERGRNSRTEHRSDESIPLRDLSSAPSLSSVSDAETEHRSNESTPLGDLSSAPPISPVSDAHTEPIPDKKFATFPGARNLLRLIHDPLCKFLRRFSCYKRSPSVEEEKIAVRESAGAAWLAGSIHAVPILATMVLWCLNLHGFYIGQELEGQKNQNDLKFFGLQFAAKLHELSIGASLTAVIFSYIRRNLIKDRGLPFGAIVAGLQYKDTSYLLSMEFWGAARASCLQAWDKAILLSLVLACAVLAVLVGPASATLMIPRLDYWPAGGTDFWIALHPSELNSINASAIPVPASCMNDTGALSCPSGGWQVIAQDYLSFYRSSRREGYLPDYTYVPGEKAVLAIRTFTRSTDFQFNEKQTQATVGSSSVADGLVETGRLWAWAAYNWRYNGTHERFWSRIDAVYSVEAQQPIVHARCAAHDASDYASASTVAVYDLWDQDYFQSHGDFETLGYNYTDDGQVDSLVQSVLDGESKPQVAWATIPQSNGTTLGATLSVPMEGNNPSMLFQCTIAARMAPGNLESTRNNLSLVTGADHSSIYDNDNTFPRISIEPAWAAFLNPTIASDNSTAFQYMMQAAGILDGGFAVEPETIVYVIESLLTLSVVNGLARRDFGANFSGTLLGNIDGLDLVSYRHLNADEVGVANWECNEWCGHLLPNWFAMRYGGNAFNISDAEKEVSTKFTMRAGVQGYAYNPRGAAAKFAMIVLFGHFSIACIHLGYIVYDGKTSSSWGSISELVALAMNSNQSERLKNTGAGIDDDTIFEERTRVIEKDGHLQLVVGDPVQPYNPVVPEKEYG